jgi:hypothetical protein
MGHKADNMLNIPLTCRNDNNRWTRRFTAASLDDFLSSSDGPFPVVIQLELDASPKDQ